MLFSVANKTWADMETVMMMRLSDVGSLTLEMPGIPTFSFGDNNLVTVMAIVLALLLNGIAVIHSHHP